MLVDLVKVDTRDGVRLDGTLQRPREPKTCDLDVDAVIFHHGVGGNFYGPGMFDDFSTALLDKGCAVLRVNCRGHDPICRALVFGEYQRMGAAYEDMEGCLEDWAAWIDYAQAVGYRRIGLWGHSLGATKSIYYMAVRGDSRVTRVVAGSPPRFSYSAFAATEEGTEFLQVAAQARQLVETGQAKALLEARYPFPLLITAEVFMQKYGPEEKYDILRYIPEMQTPTLITIGTEEARTMTAFKGLPEKVLQLAKESAPLAFESIPGADHAYTNRRNYVWDVVSRWLQKV